MKRQIIKFLFVLIGASWAIIDTASGQFEVIESNAKTVQLGDAYSESDQISISENNEIKLLDTVSGNTLIIKGPFKGRIVDYKAQDPSFWEKLFGTKKEVEPPVGGTREFRK